MSTQSEIAAIRSIMAKLDANRVSKFSYTDPAFSNDVVDGVSAFDVNAEQNIPLEGYTNFNDTVRGKGVRTQGASLPRMGINHFFGRMSYNLNKLVQKFSAWMDIDIAARAYNAAEYDPNAPYKTGGICYAVETKNGVKTITYYTRSSATPDTITGIPVTNQNHWSEVIDKKSGVHHKYVIADLTTGYDVNTWYPVTTKLADFDAQVSGSKDPAMRQVVEVFYNGAVQGRANVTRGELLVSTKFTGLAASTDTIVYDRSYTDTVASVTADDTTIGYSTLPLGKQAVVWLRGGTSYALWNSFASEFTIHTSAYANGLDTSISPSASQVWSVLSSNLDVSVRRLANATPGSRGIDYLKASTVTTIAALILADLKTVDGAGSGLDADTLDGVHRPLNLGVSVSGIPFLVADVLSTLTHVGDSYNFAPGSTGVPFSFPGNWQISCIAGGDGGATVMLLASLAGGGSLYLGKYLSGVFSWSTIFTSSTDGAGSGLDADTLDGVHRPLNLGVSVSGIPFLVADVLSTLTHVGDSYNFAPGSTGVPFSFPGNWQISCIAGGNGGATVMLLASLAGGGSLYLGKYLSGVLSWSTIFTSSTDGAGSGLDADTLDGFHAGNADGNIPLNNGSLNVNLRAAISDHASEASAIDIYQAGAVVPAGYYLLMEGNGTIAVRQFTSPYTVSSGVTVIRAKPFP